MLLLCLITNFLMGGRYLVPLFISFSVAYVVILSTLTTCSMHSLLCIRNAGEMLKGCLFTRGEKGKKKGGWGL